MRETAVRENVKTQGEKAMADLKTLLGDSYKDGMTFDEISAVLGEKELVDLSISKLVKKDVFDKTASELAKYKKQLSEKLTEEEQKAQEQAELLEKLKTYEESTKRLKLETALSKSGFDEKHIGTFAEAFLQGDTEKLSTVMANLKSDIITKTKNDTTAELLKTHTHTPPAGNGKTTITKEQFKNATYAERAELYSKNPEAYAELSKSE